ncbi:MAG: rod shape-determining protein MreC, partial [Cyclobacteriaceae bacterium]|nr:rod shape-determining protein MreC [Cyclobacteriaceae bacterium]
SSRIKSNGEIGTVRWNGENAGTANLDYIARHIKLQKGDTVVTSGFNAVFPPGILIGTIGDFDLTADEMFYQIDVSLSTPFNSLSYVYIVENKLKQEIDSLYSVF